MTTTDITDFLLWCVGINYGFLLFWFGVFAFAHDRMYRLHSRWLRLSVETFDAIHFIKASSVNSREGRQFRAPIEAAT